MSARSLRALVIAGLLAPAGIAQAAIPASERTVLLNLYTSTGGATWATSTNWNGPPGTECTWYGVTCDVGGTTVTSIYLGNNNLTGSLPGNLNGLTNLEFLAVEDNQLTGSIPALTGLTNLRLLRAYNNQLTGSIPALTGLTNLDGFEVSSNQLTGSIPALTGLTTLSYFGVSFNQLSGPIPTLTGLTNLQGFAVRGNQLTGSIPALTGLTNMTEFVVESNQLTGQIPALTGLSNLRRIRVSHNQLTGNVPSVPAPNDLLAGSSSLCPNFLNQTTNAEWDIATGVTPWFANCASAPLPPALLGAASRKVHGVAGTFDLPLTLAVPPAVNQNPTTEPRQGPTATIVLTFDKPISSATATITEGAATAGVLTFAGNDVVVPLTGVPNQRYVTVSLTNVAAVDGGSGGVGSVRVGFLLGDVNQSRVVTVSDLAQVNAQIAQVVGQGNYLKDVNASGTLTVADKGIANTQITKALPTP